MIDFELTVPDLYLQSSGLAIRLKRYEIYPTCNLSLCLPESNSKSEAKFWRELAVVEFP